MFYIFALYIQPFISGWDTYCTVDFSSILQQFISKYAFSSKEKYLYYFKLQQYVHKQINIMNSNIKVYNIQ